MMPFSHGLFQLFDRKGMTGDEQDFARGAEGLYLDSEIYSWELRHLDVRDEETGRGDSGTLQSFKRTYEVLHLESAAMHDSTKDQRDDWLIIDHENTHTFAFQAISSVYYALIALLKRFLQAQNRSKSNSIGSLGYWSRVKVQSQKAVVPQQPSPMMALPMARTPAPSLAQIVHRLVPKTRSITSAARSSPRSRLIIS